MSRQFVLDAWALLALLQKEEPAASRVKQLLEQASENDLTLYVSIINIGEVIYSIGRREGDTVAYEVLQQIRRLPVAILQATEEAVLSAVSIKMHHRVSYADAFAASAAKDHSATLVTGDPELIKLGDAIQVEALMSTPSQHRRSPSTR